MSKIMILSSLHCSLLTVILFAVSATAYSAQTIPTKVTEQPIPKVPITCLLIDKASILTQRFDEPPYGRANVGHQIGNGVHSVLSMRAWEDRGESDSAQLWKITLEFASLTKTLPLGKVAHIPVLRSYFTYGGLVRLNGGGYVWGENSVREVDLIRTKTGLEAVIHGPISATAAISGAATRTTGDWRCEVTARKVNELGFWEGKPGTTFESFHPAETLRPVDHL